MKNSVSQSTKLNTPNKSEDLSTTRMIQEWIASGAIPKGSLSAQKLQGTLLEAGYLRKNSYGDVRPGKGYWAPTDAGLELGIHLKKELRDSGIAAWPIYSSAARKKLLDMVVSSDLGLDFKDDSEEGREVLEVILLTKSTKHGGFCVAGVDTTSGAWVRLMTSEDEFPGGAGALSERHLTTADGTHVGPLDVVRFDVAQRCPNAYQVENVEVDFSRPIRKVRSVSLDEACNVHPAEARKNLFYTKYDTLKEELADKIDYSLILAKVRNVHLYAQRNSRGNIRARADFTYVPMRGLSSVYNPPVHYKGIRVTIPAYDNMKSDIYMDEAYFVLSVGMPWEGKIYKYVAAIYECPRKKAHTPMLYEPELEDELI